MNVPWKAYNESIRYLKLLREDLHICWCSEAHLENYPDLGKLTPEFCTLGQLDVYNMNIHLGYYKLALAMQPAR